MAEIPLVFERYVVAHKQDGKMWYWHHQQGWRQGFENGYWFKEREQAQTIADNINKQSLGVRNAHVKALKGKDHK